MASGLDPAVQEALDRFRYAHLPPVLREVSKPFHDLAHHLAQTVPAPAVVRALDYLFDAKNWAVVAAVTPPPQPAPASCTTEPGDT